MSYKGEVEIWCAECRKMIGKEMGAHEIMEVQRKHTEINGHSKFMRVWGKE